MLLTGIPIAFLTSTDAGRPGAAGGTLNHGHSPVHGDSHADTCPCRDQASPDAGRNSLIFLTCFQSLQTPNRRAGRLLAHLHSIGLALPFSIYTLIPSSSCFLFRFIAVPVLPHHAISPVRINVHNYHQDYNAYFCKDKNHSMVWLSPSREMYHGSFYIKEKKAMLLDFKQSIHS